MKNFFGLSLLLLTLSACSAEGISKDDPEGSANYIKEHLSIESDIENTQEEYYMGIMDVYNIGEDIDVIADDKDKIEQINFSDVDEDDIQNILSMIEFPESESIESFVDDYYMDIAATGSYEADSVFTSYEDVGVMVGTKIDILKEDSDNPFSLSLYYNPERFEKLREIAL